jgi:hypothetical protein
VLGSIPQVFTEAHHGVEGPVDPGMWEDPGRVCAARPSTYLLVAAITQIVLAGRHAQGGLVYLETQTV